MFLVQSGELLVYTGSKASPIELARLGPGSVVGEVALFDNKPRSASVQALCTTQLAVVPENILIQVFRSMPAWLFAVVKSMCSRLRDTNARMNATLVQDIPRALAVYLHSTCQENPVEMVPCLETFAWISRVSLRDAQDTLQLFVDAKWLRLYNSSESGARVIGLAEPMALEAFYQFRELRSTSQDFPPFALDPVARAAVESLRIHAQDPATSEPAWFSRMQSYSPLFTIEHLLRFKNLGLLAAAGDGQLKAVPARIQLFVAALAHEDTIRRVP